MVLPVPNQDVLEALYEKRRECAMDIHAAEARGDLKETRKLRIHMREIISLIIERGGDLNV